MKKKQKLQPVQAYTQLYYGKKKDIIAERWEKYVKEKPELKTQNGLPPLWFRNRTMRELLKDETEEVKEAVAKRQEELLDDEHNVIDVGDLNEKEATRLAKTQSFQKYAYFNFLQHPN
jgi:hypothetical protein